MVQCNVRYILNALCNLTILWSICKPVCLNRHCTSIVLEFSSAMPRFRWKWLEQTKSLNKAAMTLKQLLQSPSALSGHLPQVECPQQNVQLRSYSYEIFCEIYWFLTTTISQKRRLMFPRCKSVLIITGECWVTQVCRLQSTPRRLSLQPLSNYAPGQKSGFYQEYYNKQPLVNSLLVQIT